MNVKTAAITLATAAAIAILSGCTASDEPALEKGQPASDTQQAEQVKAAPVPEECFDAFSDAEQIDGILSEGVESAGRSIDHAINLDVEGLEEETAIIERLTDDASEAKDDYLVAAAVCEGNNPPQVCSDALRSGEKVSALLADALDSSSRALGYALDYDADGLDEETRVIEDIKVDLDQARSDFDSQTAECGSGV